MSITRLLIVAGLVGVGACGTGPTGLCYFDDQVGAEVCTIDQGTSQSESPNLPIITPPIVEPEN